MQPSWNIAENLFSTCVSHLLDISDIELISLRKMECPNVKPKTFFNSFDDFNYPKSKTWLNKVMIPFHFCKAIVSCGRKPVLDTKRS